MDMGEVKRMSEKIKVSVVTVCYNEVADIVATLQSVTEQTYGEIEHIVQDGGSVDGTVEIIRQYACGRAKVVMDSAKDGGIYYGMNAGLSKCTGDYVIFCNGGDRFASEDVIEQMVAKASAEGLPDLVYGDCASEVNGQLMVRTAHGPGFINMGMPAAHESMMYKLSLVNELHLKYDTSYRIGADYKFTYQFVRCAKRFAYVSKPIIVFSEGGVSTAQKWRGMFECSRARKEAGGISLSKRAFIVMMQAAVLAFSGVLGPLYRFIRLKRVS